MYHLDNGQRSYKPQTNHEESMILPSSSKKYLQTHLLNTRELRNRPLKVSDFVVIIFLSFLLSSFSYKTLD